MNLREIMLQETMAKFFDREVQRCDYVKQRQVVQADEKKLKEAAAVS
jgi:hypothetical protein